MNARTLVINADDLGLAPGVNRGIAEALAAGVVRSTSLMVTMRSTADGIAQLRALRERGADIGVGLHFDLVAGAPLTAARSLRAREDRPLPFPVLLWRAWTGRIAMNDVRAELEAQLERATQLLAPIGLPITHIDSHRHTHTLPGISDVVREVARANRIPHVRRSFESGRTLLGRPRARVKAVLLRAALGRSGATDDVGFAGIALMASPTFDADLLALADALPPGITELMVHPGYDCAELAAIDPYRTERERELRALTSPALASEVRKRGIRLSHFGECATAPPA